MSLVVSVEEPRRTQTGPPGHSRRSRDSRRNVTPFVSASLPAASEPGLCVHLTRDPSAFGSTVLLERRPSRGGRGTP